MPAAYDNKNYCVASCYEVPFSIYNDNLSQCSSKEKTLNLKDISYVLFSLIFSTCW